MEGEKHFHKEYDSVSRFISYYYQCSTVLGLKPKSVLEVGVGNKLVSSYLKNNGVDVTTCDYDKTLKPDVVSDIRDLSKFKDNSFDVVIAFEILEHIPWNDLDKALSELKRVSKKYVVISVPHTGWFFNVCFEIPFTKKRLFNIGFTVSRFWANMKPRAEHYWEIGFKNYSLSRVRGKLKEYFTIDNDFQIKMNRYHHFFVMEK